MYRSGFFTLLDLRSERGLLNFEDTPNSVRLPDSLAQISNATKSVRETRGFNVGQNLHYKTFVVNPPPEKCSDCRRISKGTNYVVLRLAETSADLPR